MKNTSASPRAAKQAHAITGESVSSASSARQRGRNSRAKKPRAEAMPWIRAERSDRSLVSPVGNRAARIPAPRAKPPRDTANPAASHREAGAAPTA